jgi:hypothetical protein
MNVVETGVSSLGVLEEKINKAVEMITRLKQDKNNLEEINKELKEKLDLLYIKNEELMKELKKLKHDKERNKKSDKTREEIKNKIEGMLVKLEEFEI